MDVQCEKHGDQEGVHMGQGAFMCRKCWEEALKKVEPPVIKMKPQKLSMGCKAKT